VLWLPTEIGASYDLTKVEPAERRSGEHLARHPLGRVPALELGDGTVIFESAAICIQLADLHPESGLIPPLGSSQRGLVYQWAMFAMTELETLYSWIREGIEDGTDSPSRGRFVQAAAAVAAALDGHDWLVADRFSVADVLWARVLGSANSRALLTEWPPLVAYVERAEGRPAFIEAAAISDRPRG